MNRSQQSVVGYAVLSFLTITIVFGLFNIANSDLHVPLYYGHDALEWIALLEGYLSGQHYSDLYAPLGFVHETSILISLVNWITTPFWLLAIHGLSLLEQDPVWIINVYSYLSYLLTSLAMAYLLRNLRCGWPITIAMKDNDGRRPSHWLKPIQLDFPNPVVQVIREDTGEVLYTRRVTSPYRAGVFTAGKYTVRAGTDRPGALTLRGLEPVD